ncbi:unnamed protein product [Larinioides sclopetarius]|uniref:Uncharacterized protein n=1 Tax=Larinioides sclopetarius TaxID=280406 RepID=A0AAV2A4K8_9ARAC
MKSDRQWGNNNFGDIGLPLGLTILVYNLYVPFVFRSLT